MTEHIVKTSRDSDLYCVWSTVVDAPTHIGTREELGYEYEHAAPERFARADERGTSARWPSEHDAVYGWSDESLSVMTGPGASGELSRESLEAYCRHLLAGEDEDAASLVAPTCHDDTEE